MGLFGTSAKRKETPQEDAVELQRRDHSKFLGKVFLGKYRTVRFLGEGSNAEVYLADAPANSRRKQVVVKRIKEEAAAAPRFRQFFNAEVSSMAKFSHPYVVKLLDASLDDPLGACLVMEYLPGITLEDVLLRERTMAPDRVGRFLGPLGHALFAAQEAGIAHRDLKPANLMIVNYGSENESLRVMDFGFAGFTSKPHIQLAELTGQGSKTGCGTPAYVSPEMVRGDSTDIRADIYSVGVILYEMLTGRLPFEYMNTQDLLEAHVKESPPRFHRIGCSHIPPTVEAVVQIAMSKYPSERQASMKELVDQFSRAVGWNIWDATQPNEDVTLSRVDELLASTKKNDRDEDVEDRNNPFVLSDIFEATLPEKLAALKLRGFIEDVLGTVIESEPGLIRVQVELPPDPRARAHGNGNSSGVFAFLSGVIRSGPVVVPGKEPIEIQFRMNKIDANKVKVQVAFRPVEPYRPSDPKLWGERCERYYSHLRSFIMPEA
jgi:serine/threonine protein kinase